jgi:hypothetical protein
MRHIIKNLQAKIPQGLSFAQITDKRANGHSN